jgi:hypothetical protein
VDNPDRKLTEPGEGLIRRVWKTPRKWSPVHDQITGQFRAPTAAFELRPSENALSVNVESSLVAAGLPLTWSLDPKKQYAARITVFVCNSNGLEAFHNPVPAIPPQPANPHHGLICGLIEIRSNDPLSYERVLDALAKASIIVPDQAMPSGTAPL